MLGRTAVALKARSFQAKREFEAFAARRPLPARPGRTDTERQATVRGWVRIEDQRNQRNVAKSAPNSQPCTGAA